MWRKVVHTSTQRRWKKKKMLEYLNYKQSVLVRISMFQKYSINVLFFLIIFFIQGAMF